MGLLTTLARALPQKLRRQMAEALTGTAFGTPGPDDDVGLVGFRRLTDRFRTRDLDIQSHVRHLKIAHWLYDSNPFAHWLIDQRVDLVLGPRLGYSVEVDHQRAELGTMTKARALAGEIKDELDRFWRHPTHNFESRAVEYLTTYLVTGHLTLPIAALNPVTGFPQLDFIDAEQIVGVKPREGSALVLDQVLVTAPGSSEPKSLPIVCYDSQQERWVGDVGWCFYWRNSRLLNATRGRSEFLQLADWLDGLDQFLFARLDRAVLSNSALWDVTLKGAQDDIVKRRAKEIKADPPSKPGTVIVHNDAEEWKAITPDLKATDAHAEIESFLHFILGSKGIPESWFASGAHTNRATAGEQNDIAYKTLEALQEKALQIFRVPLEFAYDQLQAKQSGRYPPRSTGAVTIRPDLPPISERDISRVGGVIANVETALENAVGSGIISKQTAQKVMVVVSGHLGVPVDSDDEMAQIAAEAKPPPAVARTPQDKATGGGDGNSGVPADAAGGPMPPALKRTLDET